MKRILVAVAVLGSLTACSSSLSAVQTGTAAAPAHVGSALTLRSQNGNPVKVEILKVSPATEPPAVGPAKGMKLVAVQVRLTNVGSATSVNDADMEMLIVDSDGQRFTPEWATADVEPGPKLQGEGRLEPGDVALGWVTFEVPEASTVAKVGYTNGVGEHGVWMVG